MSAAPTSTLVRRASAVVVAALVAAGVTTGCSPVAGHSTAPPRPTPAVVTQVRIADLPRTDAPSSYYLSGDQIHTATGQVIPLRLDGFTPDTHGSTRYDFSLLGLTPRGYVVERRPGPYESGFTEAYLVTSSGTRLLDRSPEPVRTGYILSSDGTRLLRSVSFGHAFARFTVLDLDGAPLATTNARGGDSPWLLAVTRGAVWYEQADGDDGPEGVLSEWDYQSGATTDLGRIGWYADPSHNLLFTGSSTGAGPTSLSKPSRPVWSEDFAPLTLSSDGTYVVGVSPADSQDTTATPTVEVRRVDDGTLADSFVFPPWAWFTDAWWEDDDTVLLAVSFHTTPYAGRLVRCRLSGSCELVGPLVTGSYSHGPTFGWWVS